MININILKPNRENFKNYLYIGTVLIFLGIFDVFLQAFLV